MSNLVTNLSRSLVMTPAQKSVQMCLSDFSDDSGKCWPSLGAIGKWTCLQRSAVIAALKALEKMGVIQVDRKAGSRSTIQISLERLTRPVDQCERQTRSRTTPVRETNGDQFAKQPTPVQQTNGSGSFNAPNTSDTSNTSSETPKKKRANKSPAFSIPGVPDSLVAEYMQVRKSKRATTFGETSIKALRREAALAGLTVEQAVTECIERNWQAFNAGYYANATGKRAGALSSGLNKQEALEVSNRAIANKFLRDEGFSGLNYERGFDEPATNVG